MNTYPYLQDVQYVVAWQEELLEGADLQRDRQGGEQRLSSARETFYRWAGRMLDWHTRQAELCLEAGPACEMLFPA